LELWLTLLTTAWRAITWPMRKVWAAFVTRPRMRLTVGEVSWIGSHPYNDDFDVSAILVQVGLSNASPNPNSVSTFRLDIAGRSYFPAEHKKSRTGGQFLVPKGGGFATIPDLEGWLDPPVHLNGFSSAWGWVGFLPFGSGKSLTFGVARRTTGALNALSAAGSELRAPVPPCNLPPLGST